MISREQLARLAELYWTGYSQTQSPFFKSSEPSFLQSDGSAVVLFVPADGIEDELSTIGAAILVRLAGDRVIGQLGDELRRQGLQLFGNCPWDKRYCSRAQARAA